VQRVRVAGELGEQAAGFDLGQLAAVPDQHEHRAAEGGVGEQRGEIAGVDDAGLVQDDDPAPVQPAGLPGGRVGLIRVGEQLRE